MPPIDGNNSRPDESNRSARNWICTLPNWKELDLAKLEVYANEKCDYMIIGKEVGKTGLKHLQIYFQLKKQTKGQTVKNQSKLLKMWMGIANSATKSRAYCQKEGDYVEFGEFKDLSLEQKKTASGKGGAGTASKWKQLHEDIKAGMPFVQLLERYPSMVMQTRNAILAECIRNAPKRDFKTCVHVYIGESGAGKTTRAKIDAGDEAFMVTPGMNHWFDGYDGRSNIIIDEMRKGQYSVGTLLSMMDQHPCSVQVKGGMVNFAPRCLVITSNLAPNQWYSEETLDHQTRTALWRRINVCKYFKKGTVGTLEDYDEGWEMYDSGCLCGEKDRPPVFLEDSSFLDQPLHVKSTPLELPDSGAQKRKTPDTPVPEPTKKKGTPPNLRGKKVKDLVAGNTAEDPFELDSESDSDDDSSFDFEARMDEGSWDESSD